MLKYETIFYQVGTIWCTFLKMCSTFLLGVPSQVALVVKNPCASAGDIRDLGSVPGSGRSPGRGHGNPLQYSCLENPMDRGAWQATVHGVTKSRTQLKWLIMHECLFSALLWHIRKWGLKWSGFKGSKLKKNKKRLTAVSSSPSCLGISFL